MLKTETVGLYLVRKLKWGEALAPRGGGGGGGGVMAPLPPPPPVEYVKLVRYSELDNALLKYAI